jgi:HK97 gp10 family phage protein
LARFIPYQGGSNLFVGAQGAAGRIKGLEQLQKRLATLPQSVVADVRAALSEGCDAMVEEMKAIAPSSELEPHPHALRDAIQKEDGRHALSFDVTCNPVGVDGKLYGAHVEFGHRARGGKDDRIGKSGAHIPAKPFFFPVYRHQAKRLKARIRAASSKAIKDLYK